MDRNRSESRSPIRRARSRSVRPRGDAERSRSRPPSVRLVDEHYYSNYGGGAPPRPSPPPPPQPRRSRSRPRRLSGDSYGMDEGPPGNSYYRAPPMREPSGRNARRRSRRQYTKDDYGGAGTRRDSRRVPSPGVMPPMPTEDQDSDNVLDDYYGGQEDDLMGGDSGPDYGRPQTVIYEERIHRPETRMSGAAPVGAAPGSQAEMEARYRREQEMRARLELEEMKARMEKTKMSTRVQEVQQTARRPDYLREPPRGASQKGLWPRAAVVQKRRPEDGRPRRPGASEHPAYLGGDEVLTVSLKLMLTRRGERFRGRAFRYVRGTWSDDDFARALQREYRSLKTQKIGWLQKLTSYRCITFVYFLQYHAYPSRRYPDGFWRISARRPVTRRDDQPARSSFMYRLKRLVREGGPGLWSGRGSEDRRRKPPPREWVDRLDCLIEPGAVLDIEIKETFDTGKIYVGLLLAVLLSLGAALAYGFATPDRDFATGFSLASWMITAFGFFAAVVAAGEVLGLEKPSAIMQAGEELSADTKLTRDMLYF